MLKTNGIVESALSVADVGRSCTFYRELFGFSTLLENEEMAALGVPGSGVLLLFKLGARTEPVDTPGGVIPAHNASGQMHLSFKISPESLAESERELLQRGVAIESRVVWPRGGTSLYFRDPDQHLIELLTPGVWEVY